MDTFSCISNIELHLNYIFVHCDFHFFHIHISFWGHFGNVRIKWGHLQNGKWFWGSEETFGKVGTNWGVRIFGEHEDILEHEDICGKIRTLWRVRIFSGQAIWKGKVKGISYKNEDSFFGKILEERTYWECENRMSHLEKWGNFKRMSTFWKVRTFGESEDSEDIYKKRGHFGAWRCVWNVDIFGKWGYFAGQGMNYVCDSGCGFGHGGVGGWEFITIETFILWIQFMMFLVIYSEIFHPADSLYKKSKQVKTLSNHNRCFKDKTSFTNWLLLSIKACLQECFLFIYLEFSLKCVTSCFNPHLYCFISPTQWS